ncbi:hypothetical protein VOLCADRAFT_104577 [Volvox carteri f. nagariensis]|uniref:Uncharacterized protein n=1 Tax=Volvox carteri f. nagariensis TaxID=3068 RepID=D8TUK4_VOLCA|nr:uncharacterized protein VOLCADRAFT_104577 [Volvox carteri f. nagariensis]EFJ48839.1 hypothetical protein VOLCADRAFT_104577 [Volvox carteri f. nagariensis]|eukprot:XP_002950171.1 hypothetical protein VOLCADRAFT_104577 [Volvox carteri f. nagariensis]
MASVELPSAAAELKDKGNKRFAEKDFKQALSYYTEALRAVPKNAVLLSNLAATHLALKQWSKALERAEECLAADPDFLKAYGRKAAAQMGLFRSPPLAHTALSFLVGESLGPHSPWPNKAFMSAFLGAEKEFLKHFRPEHLQLRALEARMPLTIVVVAGAQRIRGQSADPRGRMDSDSDRGTEHSKVLRRLIEAGARVDARDAAGWTALHHATAHHAVLDLAEMLLEAGADVNGQDRYGTYPLVSATMTAEVRSVRLLLKYGAKPDLKDNDGCDALGVSRYNTEIQSLLYNAHQNNSKAPAAVTRPGVDNDSYTSASDGLVVMVVLPHELLVSIVLNSGFLSLTNVQANFGNMMSRMAGGTGSKSRRTPAATFQNPADRDQMLALVASRATRQSAIKVKIQVPPPLSASARKELGDEADMMLCYNEDRSLVCRLVPRGAPHIQPNSGFQLQHARVRVHVRPFPPLRTQSSSAPECPPESATCRTSLGRPGTTSDGTKPHGQLLASLIRQKGILGLKGYFAAYFDDRCAKKVYAV